MSECCKQDSLETLAAFDSKEPMATHGQLASLTSIVAIDVRGALGCRNQLPWRLKSDMAFFRETTSHNSVVMGRKTFDSLGGKCLPKRKNVVLSHNGVLFPAAAECRLALSVDEALVMLADFKCPEAFVIGGAVTYREFAPLVDRYLVTVVDHEVEDADAYLANDVLAEMRQWDRREIARYPSDPDRDDYSFSVYELVAPDAERRAVERETRIAKLRSKISRPTHTANRKATRPSSYQDAFAF